MPPYNERMTSEHMARALELAASVQGSTSPNPGLLRLVRDGKVIAEATEPPPGRHAEAVALQSAGERARGATAYVTLEPHNFHAHTPPAPTP
jgi:diaminohydroxyphosphoribosylaminopyrimidine deaminase/5-amino-6-(5-phosphoribosylamino)uracil reductase